MCRTIVPTAQNPRNPVQAQRSAGYKAPPQNQRAEDTPQNMKVIEISTNH